MMWVTYSLFATAFFIAIVGMVAKVRAQQLKTQEKCREEFLSYAEHLLDDPETPDDVERLIMALVKNEASRLFLWSFVFSAVTGRLVDSTGSISVKMFHSVPVHLRDDYVGAIVTSAIGVTYNNLCLGWLVRRFMFFSVPRQGGDDIGPISPVGPMLDEFSRTKHQGCLTLHLVPFAPEYR